VKKNILFILGTRPEAIKLFSVIAALSKDSNFKVKVCLTSQHIQMLSPIVNFFKIKADFNLKIMRKHQDLYDITINVLKSIKSILNKAKPDLVIVQGDTTTAFTAALAAFYEKIPVAHVEAGLRTNMKYLPFPEEINRSCISVLADIHLAPTLEAKKNLLKLGIKSKFIFVTGNTVIDSLLFTAKKIQKSIPVFFKKINSKYENCKVILVTGHRRENFGKAFKDICSALKEVALKYPKVVIVYPVHLNPNVRKPVFKILGGIKNIYLIEPLNYPDFIWLLNRSYFVVTDSGGVQEEAPSLGKPVLVMREVTERPEGIRKGAVKLVGSSPRKIVKNISLLISDKNQYCKMARVRNIYGDGKASQRIKNIIKRYL